jgi:hypothetical protein
MPIFIAINVASSVGFGWCLEKKTNIAGPLILLFGGECMSTVCLLALSFLSAGYVSISIMNAIQTITVDMMPKQSSSVSACVR